MPLPGRSTWVSSSNQILTRTILIVLIVVRMRSSPTCSFDLARSATFSRSPRQQCLPVCHVSSACSSDFLQDILQLQLPPFFWLFYIFCYFFLGGVLASNKFLSRFQRRLAIYISIYFVSLHHFHIVIQNMLFLDKMLRQLHAIPSSWLHVISSSWDSFHQSNTFLQKMHQRLRSRTPPAYLVLAACLTTLASVILLSLGRMRYHWDSQVWDVDTTRPQGIVVPSTPRDMAANNTLGVSPTRHKVENSLYMIMMTLRYALIVSEAVRSGQRTQLAFTRTPSGGEDYRPSD